ncbi:MAG TPA: hypothetical protein PLO51_04295, partial [Candidatus Micrarchaeota archaeon]|nr:hypothetical protein [Candidatus Micrarchaeota archaeon]
MQQHASPGTRQIPGTKQGSLTVTTVFGKSAVSPNEIVYVRLMGKYARKRAGDLVKGEEVLFRKDSIPGITIEKVEEAIIKSTRYATSQQVLFRQIEGAFAP